MLRILTALIVILASVDATRQSIGGAEPATLNDFKLTIAQFGAGQKSLASEEVVVRNGLAFHFISGESLEVILIDPVRSRLELIDLDRKVRTEVSFRRLEIFQEELFRAINASSVKQEKRGGRANSVSAAMSRNLIDPRFASTYDAMSHKLRLTNSTVEVDAKGEPDSDQTRLGFISRALAILVKLESFRDPTGIPPFSKLAALDGLIESRKLRPTELSFLFRLAGPPKRLRWTYELESKLTERETEALARIDAMRQRCRLISYEEYDHVGKG